MNWDDRKIWIRRIWSHHYEAIKCPEQNLVRTYFSECVKATIILLLNREYTGKDRAAGYDIAWGDRFIYGEYGCGNGWHELIITSDWKFSIEENGDY